MIPVYKPYIPHSSIEYATNAIKSSWISSIGKYLDLTTEKLSEFIDCKYIILVNNGTSATHLVARSLKKFRSNIKTILVPSACYVAAYNSLSYDNNNWNIRCIDLNMDTWNMDVKNVAKDEAIFAVHNLGNIINIPNLKKKFDCAIIEDNCEGFFGRHGETSSGSESLCSSLSFYGNKNITCGEGGAFMTNDEEIYKYALKLRGQGQSSERYIHDELGYNYRMTNVQAAILLGQLENSDYIVENKNRVFKRYANNLCNIPGIRLQKEEDNTQHSKWMFGVRFINLNDYKSAEPYFKKHGIDTRPMFYSFREHKHLNLTGEDKNAIIINKEVIVFPSYPELTDNEIDYICDIIIKFNNKRKI